jgi:hypothetical protein
MICFCGRVHNERHSTHDDLSTLLYANIEEVKQSVVWELDGLFHPNHML